MNDFEFLSPTRILFGRNTVGRTGEAVRRCDAKKVLVHYGGGAVRRIGVLDAVLRSLDAAGVAYGELGGVQPNPRLGLVRQGIALVRREGFDFLLAVGGGSAIDSAKAIALGAVNDADIWDVIMGGAHAEGALPVGCVLTIPAAGSEGSSSMVITNEENHLKRGYGSDALRPRFAVLDPEVTFTLPPEQTRFGAADILSHVMERYFSRAEDCELTDRLCEAVMLTMVRELPRVLEDPKDYGARANILWASTLAHNDLLSTGRVGDWASHGIEHELSGEYDIAHGEGLAIVFPAWMKEVMPQRVARFVQFAVRIWGVDPDPFHPERTAEEGIRRFEAFYRSVGLPVRLSEIGIGPDRLRMLAERARYGRGGTIGNFVPLDVEAVHRIYRKAL